MREVEDERNPSCHCRKDEKSCLGKMNFEIIKTENLELEMKKISRRFERFEGHVTMLRADVNEARALLSVLMEDLEKLDKHIACL